MAEQVPMLTRHEPGYAIVTVAGELDIPTVPQPGEQPAAVPAGHHSLVTGLSQLGFPGACAPGVLVNAAIQAEANGPGLQEACPRNQAWRLLRLTGLDQRLPLAQTLPEALAVPGGDGVMPAGKPTPHRPPRTLPGAPQSPQAGSRPQATAPAPMASGGDRRGSPA